MSKLRQFEKPTSSEKAVVEKVGGHFLRYFSTPEGIEVGERLSALMEKLEAEETARFDSLSDTEKAALKFVATEIMNGREVTVRAVANAVGFKSSRSGAAVIDSLISKQFLVRGPGGILEVL